jgi:two-component system, chemotaxis family, sensor kinase CheA
MDSVDAYLPMFLAEAREHLEGLNLAVVRVEEQPDDRATVDEIFRAAHSLKGMSATMGFAAMAELTHEMEDVFELLRQRSGGLSREAIDVLLACLDALTASTDSIEAGDGENLDPAPLTERLKGLVRQRSPEQAVARVGGEADLHTVAEQAAGRPVAEVVVRLADDAAMPAVRAYMALQAVAANGELLLSVPSAEAVDAFEGRVLHAYVVDGGPSELEAVLEAARGVPDVAEATARPWTPEAAPEVPRPEPVAAAPAPASAAPEAPKGGHHKAASVRVDAERLDQLMHLMGEVVVARTHLEAIASGLDHADLHQAVADLTRGSQALQAMVMQVRMMPVEAVFVRMPRLVRDLSTKLGKQVDLKLVGQDTELDRTVVDALGDPLVHLVRNALDHGLEAADDRVAAGKPARGTLEIAARHAGGNVVISVRDDGRGIDPRKVAAKAVERGLITADAAPHVDAAKAVELLFAPGFSTAETTSDISGRGVGMDAVRTTIRELGGEVSMTSELGAGTTATVRLPLTLAIVAALLVDIGGAPFALPLDRVERTLRLEADTVRSAAGRRVMVHDGEVVPVVDGRALYGFAPGDDDHAVIVHGRSRRLALPVSALVGQRELVTRPLPAEAAQGAVAGGAVLSDGSIALIIDCDRLEEDERVPALAAA